MDITTAFKLNVVGTAGYVFAQYAKINTNQTVIIWMIAELAGQIFSAINNRFELGFSNRDSKIVSIGVGGGVALCGMISTRLINNVSQPILTYYGFLFFLAATSILLELKDFKVTIKGIN